jgi:tetratricopeptide (TPR) repeat protein
VEDDLISSLTSANPARSLGVLEQLLEAAKSAGDAEGQALVLRRAAQVRFRAGELEAAAEACAAAAAVAEAAGLERLAAESRQGLADAFAAMGRFAEGVAVYLECADALDRCDRPGGAAACRAGAGRCLAAQGRTEDAERLFAESLQTAAATRDNALASDCHAGLGEMAEDLGDLAGARDAYETALVTAEEAGDAMRRANNSGRLAGALVRLEDFAAAEEHARLAATLHSELAVDDLRALDLWHLGDALAGQGRMNEAREVLLEAAALFGAAGAVEQQAEALRDAHALTTRSE